MSDSTVHNLIVGSWDLSTVFWGNKATRSGETFHGGTVGDLGAGQWGIIFPTSAHRADARATSGAEYVLSFWARADVDGDKIHSEVWGSLYRLDAKLTTEWRLVTMPYGILKADQRDVFFWGLGTNSGSVHVALPMANRGTIPAAWAPAEGETLAGGGAQMSANLWKAESVTPAGIPADGIYACSGTRGVMTNVALDRLAENQTFHCGFSVNPGANDAFNVTLCYRDAAGSVNYAAIPDASVPAGKWTRVSGSVVVPSGMTVYQMVICNDGNASGTSGWKVTNPTLSLGSPVPLATSAHTPYATEGHLQAVYATQASLKVQSDRVSTEVAAREQTDAAVSTLSTNVDQTATGLSTEVAARKQTDASLSELSTRVTQTETDITTEISNRKQAVSDAQTAAVNSANANTATMIRQYSGGVLVGKTGATVGALVNANGSFDVVPLTWSGSTPEAGTAIASFEGDNISFFGGMSEFPTTSISEGGVHVDPNGCIRVEGTTAIFGDKFGYTDENGGKYYFAVYDDGPYTRGGRMTGYRVLYSVSSASGHAGETATLSESYKGFRFIDVYAAKVSGTMWHVGSTRIDVPTLALNPNDLGFAITTKQTAEDCATEQIITSTFAFSDEIHIIVGSSNYTNIGSGQNVDSVYWTILEVVGWR